MSTLEPPTARQRAGAGEAEIEATMCRAAEPSRPRR